MRPVYLLAALMGISGMGLRAQSVSLTVEVRNVPSAEGTVKIALYDSPRYFTKEEGLYRQASRKAHSPVTVFRFRVAGHRCYATTAYHDANDNAEFDRNFIGYPEEAFGFSNNAVPSIIRLSPPSFDEAKVCIRGDTTIVIRLKAY